MKKMKRVTMLLLAVIAFNSSSIDFKEKIILGIQSDRLTFNKRREKV